MKAFQNNADYAVASKINIALILVVFFFCGFLSFAQNDNNLNIDEVDGVVSCPSGTTDIGDSRLFGTKRIYVVGDTELDDVVSGGSFSVGASTFTPADLSCVCITRLTNLNNLFSSNASFNDDIGNWDTSNVTAMGAMFRDASSFNQDISKWDVSNVINMTAIFRGAQDFNNGVGGQDLNDWDTSNVTTIEYAFNGAKVFNNGATAGVSTTLSWDVGNVDQMQYTFQNADAFNANLSNWDTGKVFRMDNMFTNADLFNNGASQGVPTTLNWDTSSVVNMANMFYEADNFNANISNWDVGNVRQMNSMFREARFFNNGAASGVSTTLSWDTSSVITMAYMFALADNFNANISNWDTSLVANMINMFWKAWVFNNGASSGASTTLSWNTSSVTDMRSTFNRATAFNGNLSGWDTSKVTRMDNMFDNNPVFNNGASAGASSTILSWDTSKVTQFNNMFTNADAFNADISSWDTSSLLQTYRMFKGADVFNSDIGGWNVSIVNNMAEMFENASAFNQDLTCWDVDPAPIYDDFSTGSPLILDFVPRWNDPNTPSISYTASTAEQDDSPLTPTIVSLRGTFTASITGGLVHRVNQWGSGNADFLSIDATTGVIDPSNSLAGIYDITYTNCFSSFTTSITIRSVNDPGYQLSYASSPICRNTGGTLTPTIIPTNSHRTLPNVYLDPGNPASWTNVGSVTGGTTGILSNLTTNSSFTHWELKDDNSLNVWIDNPTYHPDFVTRNNNGNIKHNEGMSLEFTAPGGLNDLIENDYSGDRGFFPRKSQSISVWVKEYDWTDRDNKTIIYEWTSGSSPTDPELDPQGISSLWSQGGKWKYRIGSGPDRSGLPISPGAGHFIIADNTLNNNQWYHLLITRDVDGGPGSVDQTGVVKFYVDAVLTGTVTETYNLEYPAEGTIMFGRNSNGERNPDTNGFEFEGEFGPIRIFAHELTQSEVEHEYDMFALRYKPDSFTATPGGLSINPTSGIIDVSASVSGTYEITASWTEPTSGKVHTSSNTITIEDPDAGFSYPLNNYCQTTLSEISPAITGDAGGVFSVSPAGLVIDSTTGVISPTASSVNTYTVEYAISGACSLSSTFTIAITDFLADASFNYPSTYYCQGSSVSINPVVTNPGGTFTSNPAGLDSNLTGRINIDSSSPGTYVVEYSTAGDCSSTSTRSIQIDAPDVPSLSYSSYTGCENANPSLNFNPTLNIAGGNFTSSPSGLNLNSTSGIVTPFGSSTGTYTIVYTTPGSCPGATSVMFEVYPAGDPTFNYSQNSFCKSFSSTITPTISTIGGTFSSSPAGLIFNASSGAINPAISSTGTYTLEYTIGVLCSSVTSTIIIINNEDDSTFTYSDNIYCQTNFSSVTPTSAASGGIFTSSPLGLPINATTGAISPSISTAGTYTIEFTSDGICSTTSSLSMEIKAPDNATFSYPINFYCKSTTEKVTPTLSIFGGTFTSSPSGLDIDSLTGEIDTNLSAVSTYTIEYTSVGICAATASFTLVINESISISNTSLALNIYGTFPISTLEVFNILSPGHNDLNVVPVPVTCVEPLETDNVPEPLILFDERTGVS